MAKKVGDKIMHVDDQHFDKVHSDIHVSASPEDFEIFMKSFFNFC